MDFDTRYKKLNAKQKEAVDHIDGTLMVIAGPGTGKTELLSMRTANILQRTDTLPENILCLTFTESGADAMRARLEEIIGPSAYKVAIHTFHSFGSEVINQYAEYFYQGANFRAADELASYEILRSIFDELDYNNPLVGKMNGEYTHMADTLTAISELKKSGLTNEELLQVLDANTETLDAAEPALSEVFASRISQKTITQLEPIAHTLASVPQPILPPGIQSLSSVLALSLAHAIDAATDSEKTTPITAWKNAHMEKDDTGKFVFKDRKRMAKLRALSQVYYQYLVRMQESELYDFDDMVLRVVHAMEVFPDLRYNLQERYQYIMVDEFQDTNLAQARILHNLTHYETGDAPNLMVVGDDDQAIYSFQGAEISNILQFQQQYESAQLVTLSDNYRSAEVILEHSRTVITEGSERLETTITGIDKSLTAHHSPKTPTVQLHEYSQLDQEREAIAAAIKKDISSGVSPDQITVLARRHHELVSLLPYFAKNDIAVNYEKRDNVLENDVVMQLQLLAEVVSYIATKRLKEADERLPELLAHPAWNIAAADVWKLSLAAHKNHTLWLDEMSTQPTFTQLHQWLVATAQQSLSQPLETMLDTLIGVPSEGDNTPSTDFSSPLYGHFFSDEHRNNEPSLYLEYLEALRTVRTKLREYKPASRLTLDDFIQFIHLHNQIGRGINSVRSRSNFRSDAINLMTAHKSKGLEFERVYIHGAIDSSWGERVRSRSRLLAWPENLPLSPAGDTIDERIRLFFVAMTRAKQALSISYSTMNDNEKTTAVASFLASEKWQPVVHHDTADTTQLLQRAQMEWQQHYVSLRPESMKQLLAPSLENYKLSATHLNNFLDVSRGGPQYFLLNNLLRFPQGMSPSAAFGSAIHQSLQRAHMHLAANGTKKPIEDIVHDFQKALAEKYLSDEDFTHYQKRGIDALHTFLAETYQTFSSSQRAELSFSSQQSRVGTAHLTGALDVVDIDEESKSISVTDYKTGKPASSWNGKTDFEKIKLHKYKQQLMFYKLLVEHSRDYSNFKVDTGVIQFIEPTASGKITQLELSFDASELAGFQRLIQAIYDRIVALDFPDVSQYSTDYKGIQQFESDLLT